MAVKGRDTIDLARGYLSDYLSMKGINFRKPFNCLNPNHEDRNPSMSYFEKGQNVYCFSCGESYDIFDLIGLDYGLTSFTDKLEKACKLFGLSNNLNIDEKRISNKELTDRSYQLSELRDSGNLFPTYLLNRGITEESCERYNLFQKDDRVYFPVYYKDICTGWCGRAVSEEVKPKYKNSSGSLEIWNNKYLFQNGDKKDLYITEGIIDAICLEQLGYSAAALCGIGNTKKLVSLCKENPQAMSWNFILCGDPDEAGKQMNDTLSDELSRLGVLSKSLYLAGDQDIADRYLEDREKLREDLNKEDSFKNPQTKQYNKNSSSSFIDDFFEKRKNYSKSSKISTGFTKLNGVLDGGLYPALYVVGSVASLGKTSFILQLADQLTEQNQDVLFFTLEQSRQELTAKSISRITAQLDTSGQTSAFTAREILSGEDELSIQRMALLEITKKKYRESSKGLFVFEGIADIGTSEIREHVQNHIKLRGKKPIVIVDYLQILKPHDMRASDKQNTDRSVVDLKRISRDLDVPVIAVSSFNRENYRTEVSMEAFKESGAVEYSADVLFGLQLKGIGKPGFDINLEKKKEPRSIELVMLKNRNGIPYAKISLDYQAKYSLFWEN